MNTSRTNRDARPAGADLLRALAAVLSACLFLGPVAALASDSITLQSDYVVTVEYTDGHGTADGVVLPITSVPGDDTGAFSFRDARHAEVLVRLLDACGVTGTYWLLATSLTDIEYTIRVVDSSRGTDWTFTNPAGSRSQFSDLASIPCPVPRSASALDLASGAPPRSDFGIDARADSRGFFCVPDADTACLYGDVFPVEVEYVADLAAGTALAHAPNLTERTALFGFGLASIPDVAIKMVDTCSHYEVHWAQFADSTLDIEVTSFLSGLVWNSPSTTTNGVDREAFVIDADCIFAGSFELGGPWEWSSSTP